MSWATSEAMAESAYADPARTAKQAIRRVEVYIERESEEEKTSMRIIRFQYSLYTIVHALIADFYERR